MCLKRSCRSSPGICNKHRSLHFHKSFAVQISADRADDLRTFDKCIFRFRIHDKIHISLTITHICIRQSMELLRKNLKTLGKKCYMRCMNGNLSCFCLEYLSFDSDHITDIKFLKFFIIFLTDAVSCYIRLNISF